MNIKIRTPLLLLHLGIVQGNWSRAYVSAEHAIILTCLHSSLISQNKIANIKLRIHITYSSVKKDTAAAMQWE